MASITARSSIFPECGLSGVPSKRGMTWKWRWKTLWPEAGSLYCITETPSAWNALLDQRPIPATRPAGDDRLPLPTRGDMAMARARALVASGRLRDAMAALDRVRPTDVQRADADRLRTDIQRQLIGLAVLNAPVPDPATAPQP